MPFNQRISAWKFILESVITGEKRTFISLSKPLRLSSSKTLPLNEVIISGLSSIFNSILVVSIFFLWCSMVLHSYFLFVVVFRISQGFCKSSKSIFMSISLFCQLLLLALRHAGLFFRDFQPFLLHSESGQCCSSCTR